MCCCSLVQGSQNCCRWRSTLQQNGILFYSVSLMNQKMACIYLCDCVHMYIVFLNYVQNWRYQFSYFTPRMCSSKVCYICTYNYKYIYAKAKALAVRCVAGNFIHTKSSKYSQLVHTYYSTMYICYSSICSQQRFVAVTKRQSSS